MQFEALLKGNLNNNHALVVSRFGNLNTMSLRIYFVIFLPYL
jgi:hypothetical protein